MKKILLALLLLSGIEKATSQVNYQTGGATFSIPMFDWKDDKSRLNGLVALQYNSGNGLKVTEIASNVGQGWNLLAGGVITRMQVGEPDDQKPREGAVEDVNKYPPGYLYEARSPTEGCPGTLAKYPLFKDKNHIYKQHNAVASDKELDRFAFRFNGRMGMFILDKNAGNKGVSLEDSRIKIWFERDESMDVFFSARTTIFAFYIQDENGLIYKFTSVEYTRLMKTSYCDVNQIASLTQPELKGGNVYHEASFPDPSITVSNTFNSWYLSEIQDPLTQRKITFSYVSRQIEHNAGTGLSYYKEKDYTIITHIKSKTNTPVITSINFPDGHQVNFNYGQPRVDLKGDYALASVDITYDGRFLSKYQLFTNYFIRNRYGTPSGEYQEKSARLCLLSVKKFGVDLKGEDQPYRFDYYMGSSTPDDFVPPPFFHLKDIWGFYNGDLSRAYNGSSVIPLDKPITELSNEELKGLCFLRSNGTTTALNAKPGYAKNGLLRQIIYPSGGTLTYEYEQNQAMLNSQLTNVGGVHVSRIKITDGGFSNDCNNPIVTNYAYVNEGSTQPSLWGIEMPLNYMTISSYYGAEDRYFYYKPPFKFGCDHRYKFPGILSRDQGISLTANQQLLLTLSNVLDVISGIMTIVDIVNLCIAATPANIIAVVIDIIGSLINFVLTCFNTPTKNESTTVYYNSDLNASNPLPAQFKRVEITESSGGNGKTVMLFTSPDDYAIWEPSNPALSMKQRFAPWAYGLPKIITVKDAAGNKVKETENNYSFFSRRGPTPRATFTCLADDLSALSSCKCLVKKSSSMRITDWENPDVYNAGYLTQSTGDILVDIYGFYSGRAELSNSRERSFKQGSATQYEETITYYGYNCKNFQLGSTTIIKSDGDELKKYFTYSCDYDTLLFALLKQNNIISIPVSTSSAVVRNSGNSTGFYYLNEQVTEFTRVANGDVRPLRVIEQRFKIPQPSTLTLYKGPNHPQNSPNYVETQSFTYDAASNLVGMKDEGAHTITNIYDYKDKYVVASVINADPLLDKPAYTSFESQNFGGWVLNGTASYQTTSSVTGVRSFQLSASNSLSATVYEGKPYRLSFWASNAVTVIGNATLMKSAPTINGFTYYEYSILTGSDKISLSGNAKIDELRLYPQNARMRSVTYDPLIGKTAECDENNRITYYEYDELARLRFVKDDNKNIIRMQEYNQAINKLDASGCAVTYYNKAISEVFTKNDCGAGYIGSKVTYTIAANKYSSIISQVYADLQAENELKDLGQNYANTNGSCIQVFTNVALSENFTKEGCPLGTAGTTVTYNVPAGKYSSVISQEDADNKARYEINANGQAFANVPGNASCVFSTEPVWEGTGAEECRSGYRYVQVKDMNPNSLSYNQIQWVDTEEQANCPSCSSATCSDEGWKCVNGACEQGIRVCTYSELIRPGIYRNMYHYEFSDGSWSTDYFEEVPFKCNVD